MDRQSPASHSNSTVRLFSGHSLAKIKAAKMKAVDELLAELFRFSASIEVSMAVLKQRNPSELVPLFERYAEHQFDSYAQELLPNFSDVGLYRRHLETDVIDVISKEISPESTFVLPQPKWFSGEWAQTVRLVKGLHPEEREELRESLSIPSGDWEIYVGQNLRRHVLKNRVRGPRWNNQLLNLLFQLRYQCHLRLFPNWFDFDLRLRQHLSNRSAHWEAQACDGRLPGRLPVESASTEAGPTAPEGIQAGNHIQAERRERRKLRDEYKAECREHGVKVTDEMIAMTAGGKGPDGRPRWNTRDAVQKWIACDARYNGEYDRLIRQVFSTKPHLNKPRP